MNKKISLLMRLQELDTTLGMLTRSFVRAAHQREQCHVDIQNIQNAFEETKQSLKKAQANRKAMELEVDSKDQAIQKHNAELNKVKTNDAYKALLVQIDAAKKEKSQLEDQILEYMEKVENLQKDLKEREKKILEGKGQLEKQISEYIAEESRFKEEHQRKKMERDVFTGTLPADLRQQYEGLVRDRVGYRAVVPIVGGSCGGCKMALPPYVGNEAMKENVIITCENCSRFLYVKPPVTAE